MLPLLQLRQRLRACERTLQVLTSLALLIHKYKYWQARQVLDQLLQRRTRETLVCGAARKVVSVFVLMY